MNHRLEISPRFAETFRSTYAVVITVDVIKLECKLICVVRKKIFYQQNIIGRLAMNKKKVSFKREWNKLTAGVWDYNS